MKLNHRIQTLMGLRLAGYSLLADPVEYVWTVPQKNTANQSPFDSGATGKNGCAGIGFPAERAPLLRVVTLVVTMVASSGLAVLTLLALTSAYGAFLGSTTISVTDGVFTDWGIAGSPVAG